MNETRIARELISVAKMLVADEPFTKKMLDEITDYFVEEYGADRNRAEDAAEFWLSGRGSTTGVARKLRVKVPYNFGSKLSDRTKETGYYDL